MSTPFGWLSRLVQRVTGSTASDNALLEFESEAERESRLAQSHAPERRLWRTVVIAAALIAVAGIGISRWPSVATRAADAPLAGALASLAITTKPDGAQVVVDNVPRGTTPLALSVAAGAHTVTVRSGSIERTMTINAKEGSDIVRDIEFSSAPAVPAVSSTVTTNTRGARDASDRRSAGVAAGWVQIAAPFEVQLIEGGEVIGTSATPRMMLTAGIHDLLIANRALEFQDARRIEVKNGETMRIGVEPQEVRVNINARPWAEVSVDGQPLGETPIANARILVGTRRVVFRHPELGERQETVVVTTRPGQRISIDLTK